MDDKLFRDSLGPATERAKVMWHNVCRELDSARREAGIETTPGTFICDICGWSQAWSAGLTWDEGTAELASAGWRVRPWPLSELYVSLCPDCADLHNVLHFAFARGAEVRAGASPTQAHGKWRAALATKYGEPESDEGDA